MKKIATVKDESRSNVVNLVIAIAKDFKIDIEVDYSRGKDLGMNGIAFRQKR